MRVICECGREMICEHWEADQDEIFAIFNCACGYSFGGTIKTPDNEDEIFTEGGI